MDNDVLSAEVCTRLSADINLCAFSGNKELEYGAFLYGKEKKPNIIYFDIPSKHDDYEPSFRKIEVNTDKNGNELKFLNTGEYNNENDNSNVIYFLYNNYKFNIGYRYNYIDLLLYNIEFNCYVVVELKVTELKKEHIGQIEVYMNYIDKNLKTPMQNKTIGIIICKKENRFIIEYCSDERITVRKYELI